MDEDVRLRRHVAALAGQQQEGAHRFAIAIGRQPRATLAVAARRQRRGFADGGDHAEGANGAPERKRAQDRAAVGIENQHRSAGVGVLGEGLELARRVGGDVTDGGNPDTAVRSARVGRSLAPPFEAHRRASAVVLGYRWRGGCLDDATRKRECAPKQSAHADPHQWRFAQRFLVGVGRRRSVSHRLPVPFLEAAEIRV